MAVYGEIGETPLSLKGYRLMLNYWNRLSNLPNESLLKKALLENTNLRTKWIQTIEKLIKTFNLIETSKNSIIFKKKHERYAYENTIPILGRKEFQMRMQVADLKFIKH